MEKRDLGSAGKAAGPTTDRRTALKTLLASSAAIGAAFAPSVAVASQGGGPSGLQVFFTGGPAIGPGVNLCVLGGTGAAGNVDVRFDWVAERYVSSGNCPICGQQSNLVVNQPSCLPLLCDPIPGVVLPPCPMGLACPNLPPTTDAYILATQVVILDAGTNNVVVTVTPGKVNCNGTPRSCP